MSSNQDVDVHEGPSNGAAAPRSAGVERALARTSDAPLREGNRLVLLKNGPDTYEDWLAAIGSARRWVHLDNYIFENDEIGHRFVDALSAKAAEGVRVRVLHDWFGCLDVPRSLWAGLREAGVEVGGVCISDGWMVRSKETGLPYRDTAVSVRGPAVADIDSAFAGVWDETMRKLPDDERPRAGDIQLAGEEAVRVVIQEPRRMRTLRMLELLTAGVKERLWITDPYFLSMPILTQSLMATARDGVDVRVLTPATNDIAWIGRASRAGYRQFLEAGVRIFEYGGPMIHAKTMVADGWWSKVGSTNLNFSSLFANWEIDLVAEDPGFASKMEQLFEDDLSNGREVLLEGSGQHRRVRPERKLDTSDSGARAGVAGGGTGSGATVSRLGTTLIQKGGAPLQTHEHALAAAASGALLGASMVGARFPRLVAWPLMAVGAFFGGLGVVRAARSAVSDRATARDSEQTGSESNGSLRSGGS
jgi:cardiolipin synthase